MTSSKCAEICRVRLQSWELRCVEQHATPMMLLAVGHDAKLGTWTVLVPDEEMFDRATIKRLLQAVLKSI